MKLTIAKNKFCYISLFIYLLLFIEEKLKIFNNCLNLKIKLYLLIFNYLYETFIAVYYKQSILYKWNLRNYYEHHLISSLVMCIGYNYGPLKYYEKMIKYIFLININEITRILQTLQMNKKYIYLHSILGVYYCIKLSYYELYESYIYYKSKENQENNINKNIIIFPLLFSFYHIFIVLPVLIKKTLKLLFIV